MYRFVKEGGTSGRLFLQASPIGPPIATPLGPAITTPIEEDSLRRIEMTDRGTHMRPVGILKKSRGLDDEDTGGTDRRMYTEVLGRSSETTKISRRGPDGGRRLTTCVVRKVTTVTRGEEKRREPERRALAQPKRIKISDIVVGQEDNLTAREALLRWARRSTARYPGVRVNDFTSSWRDGMAFNAIIHRNRPDLINWREVRSHHVRERLETAFHVVEREYGVTRLLDPEDVDTHEPDEKSLITYISSLYDVFPEPPAMHPLYDIESQKRTQEYCELASSLLIWMREKTSYMQDRSFSVSLIELKKLLQECHRFKNEEVPPRYRDKQHLTTIFRELQKYFESIGEVEIDHELQPEGLERHWHRLMMAHQDRMSALESEVHRLERLQRLAEKVHREIKQTDHNLADLEVRIEDESHRLERMQQSEARTLIDSLDSEIRVIESTLQTMEHDCLTLKDGKYSQSNELHKRVIKLHQRWSNLRSIFVTKLVNRLSGMQYPVQHTVTRQTRTVTETKKVDNAPAFRDIQEHIDWCKTKLRQILEADYGSDLPSVKTELNRQQHEHTSIDQYHSHIAHSERIRTQFQGEELNAYTQKLSQLQKLYAELLSTSNKRLSDLDSLQDFLLAATGELTWLNDKEQTELSRDWADKNLDLTAVGRYYENLMSELEKREIQFSSVLDRGEALIVQGHPAVKCVESHLQALQSQWAWLLQLTLCLEVHLKHCTDYHNYYKDLKEAEQWMSKRDEILNTTYAQSDFSLDQGESLLKGMQTLREDLNSFNEQLQLLCERANTIVPLKQRRLPVNRPLQVQAICAYKKNEVVIDKGDTCTLYDNSGRVKWRVKSPRGQEGLVPGATLFIAPPEKEALEAAERLRRLFDRTVALWQRKQLRLRQNMIFATIKVVKSWDLEQFLAMGADQRTAIRKALNEDANKLLSEGDPADPQLRRLRREMDEVNRLFDEFEKRARAEEESKQAGRLFSEQCTTLHNNLLEIQRELHTLTSQPLPRDLDSLEHCIMVHQDITRHLTTLEVDLKSLQTTFRNIALKTPNMKKNLDRVQDLWKDINIESDAYADRMKSLEAVLIGLDENEQNISDLEVKLARHHSMPSTLEGVTKVHKELSNLQDAISAQQISMDKLNDDLDTCMRQVERSRSGKGSNQDLDRLNQAVERLNERWSKICGLLVDRLRSCEAAHALLSNLSGALQVEEDWLEGQVVPRDDLDSAKSKLKSAIEHVPKIDQVNLNGARFLKEAKIYESRALRFTDYLLELRPSLSLPQRDSVPPERGPLAQRLDRLNADFQRYVQALMAVTAGDREALRLHEALHAHPPHSYRAEFNLAESPDSTQYSSNYSHSYYTTRKSTTTIMRDATDHISPNHRGTAWIQQDQEPESSVHFTEIRSLKRSGQTHPDDPSWTQVHIQHPAENGNVAADGKRAKVTVRINKQPATINMAEAIERNLVETGSIIRIKPDAICLSDAIDHGLVDDSGWVVDRNSGDRFRLDAALSNGLIDPEMREVVDARSDNKITVNEAIKQGILNAKSGKYSQTITNEKLGFKEAKKRQLIIKPMTLKDVVDLNLIDSSGKINSPMNKSKLSIVEAISHGVLDGNTVRSVTDTKDDNLLTLNESMGAGIILPESKYKNAVTGEVCTIPEAVDRGLITSVSQRSIFDIDGFKCPNTGETISLNVSLSKNILRPVSGEFQLHVGTDKFVKLDEGVEQGLVRPEVLEMLRRKIGVHEQGRELTVLELVYYKIIDPMTGNLIDTHTKQVIPLDTAIEMGLITPEGALLLTSLLNITLTTQTVTKTVKRYVTISNTDVHRSELRMTFTEAVRLGLIDESTQTYTDPDSGKTVSVQQALNEGSIAPDTEDVPTTSSYVSAMETDSSPRDLRTMGTSKISKTTITKIRTSETKPGSAHRQIFEMPKDGWMLSDAIDNKMFDPVTGLFTIPGTDRLVSFEECVKLQIINPTSALVVDLHNNRNISLIRSLDKVMLNSTGHYKHNGKFMTMKEAIAKKYVILKNRTDSYDASNQRLIQITKIDGELDKVEVSKSTEAEPLSFVQVQSSDAEMTSLEPLQVSNSNLIYDPSKALIISPDSGKAENLLVAIQQGKISPETVKVKDPITGKEMDIREGMRKGIIDKESGEYKDKNGRKISFADAAKFGVLAVVGAPLLATSSVLKSLKTVIDPKTGQHVPIDEAHKRGIIGNEIIKVHESAKNDGRSGSKTTPEAMEVETKDQKQKSLVKLMDTTGINLDDGTTTGQKLREKIITEPKYQVSIGRARSLSQSVDQEAKPVVLQKMRKKIVRPKEAVETGMMDKATAEALEKREIFLAPNGDNLSLSEAVSMNNLDGNSGSIIDPQRGDVLTINQAMDRGILDPDGTNQLLVPLAKSLSVPQLKEQGLIEPDNCKIVHPETGDFLTLNEAIVCEIVDPLSNLKEPSGQKLTLEEAIKKGIVDENNSTVRMPQGDINLLEAIDKKVFDEPSRSSSDSAIPLAGMTFPVAVRRGLVDSKNKEIIHPITGIHKPIDKAIKEDFIMALPYPPSPDSIDLTDAMNANLVNVEKGTFTNPKTGEIMPISDAVETGLLVVKQLPNIPFQTTGAVTTVTETVTSYHTITTKMIELLTGYTLVSANEVRDLQTGEVIPIKEAKERGIVKDESQKQERFATREIKVNFSEAVRRGLVDMNAGTYTDPTSGNTMPIAQAVNDGILDTSEPQSMNVEIKTEHNKTENMTILEAYDSIYDEENKMFKDPNEPNKLLSFSEALKKNIVDPKSVVYNVTTGKAQTVQEGLDSGLIDPKTGEVKDPKSGSRINVKEAAKMGLLAVLGSPILAGMAIMNTVKKATSKNATANEPQVKSINKVGDRTSPTKRESPTIVISDTDSKKIPVDEVSLQIPTSSTGRQVIFERLTIADAIAQKKIEPKICRIMVKGQEMPFTVQDALDQNRVHGLGVIDLIMKNAVSLVDETPVTTLVINTTLTPEILSKFGAYDLKRGCFIDPDTGDKITFQDVIYGLDIFDPEKIFVKDLSAPVETFEPLEYALENPLIDKNTGHMVDRKTGEIIPFFECTKRGWITQQFPFYSKSITLQQALENNSYDPQTDEIIDEFGNRYSITECIRSGLLDADSISIKIPGTDEYISLIEAIERGIVDLQRGVIINIETRTEIEISRAFLQGYLVSLYRRPVALRAIVQSGLYDPNSGKILDQFTKQFTNIPDAISRNIVDPIITDIKDTSNNKIMPLEEAMKLKVLDPKVGKLLDKKSGRLLSLNEAVERDLILTKPVTWSLVEVVLRGYYMPQSGKILNPMTGDLITLAEAMKAGLVEISTIIVRNDKEDKMIPADEAIKTGLLDTQSGILTNPELQLDTAFSKGYLMSTKKPITLPESLVQLLYDPTTGLFKINDNNLTLEDAIQGGEINQNEMTVKDPRTGNIMSLRDAIIFGLIQPKMGLAIDPSNNHKMTLTDALDVGFIVPPKRKYSLPEAVFKGFYDPKSGKFCNASVNEKLSTDLAIRKGLLDPQSTIVSVNDKILPFELAVETGVVDAKRGTVMAPEGVKIDFREAFDRGILVEVRKPIALIEAILKGVYVENLGKFLDPQTGKYLTLNESLHTKLIDPNSINVRVPNGREQVSLQKAIVMGIVDDERGTVLVDNKSLSIKEAFELGILTDSKNPISIQRAIHQGIYDDKTGKISDATSGRKLTIHESIRKFIINPDIPCVWDEKNDSLLSLSESCRSNFINKRAGTFTPRNSEVKMSLSEAMSQGYIVDIESAGFELYDAVRMGFYDQHTGQLIHPVNGQRLMLKDSIKEDLVNPLNSLIKIMPSGKYTNLNYAISNKVVDDVKGIYRLPNGKKLNLKEALDKGLIVTSKKNISLEQAIRNGLYRPDTGKFIHPSLGEYFDLSSALTNGLIDPGSTVFKDPITSQLSSLTTAIDNGNIDVVKGRVLDPKSKRAYNYDVALEKGILVTLDTPIMESITKETVDLLKDSKTPRVLTLEESIKFELIDPEVAVVKDPQTGIFITLQQAIDTSIINLTHQTTFESPIGVIRPLCIQFDQVIVYLKRPITFDEAVDTKQLDLSTGKFKDPSTDQVINLKEAVGRGNIDADTALIKDGVKKKLIRLPEAFRKGIMDGEKSNVFDTKTSKLLPLQTAVDTGLLTTPKQGLSLIEALTFSLYNPTTGEFTDPFITTAAINRKRLALSNAIASGLVDPTSTVVKNPEDGSIVSLLTAINDNLVDGNTGKLRDATTKQQIDLSKALERGFILPAEARQAVEEKFRLCEDTLGQLLKWISTIEMRLANVGGAKEVLDELRNQLKALKQIKEDLDSQLRPVSSCLDSVRQLMLTGGDVLSASEVSGLETSGRELRSRVDRANEKTSKLIRKITTSCDQLGKLRGELNTFSEWLESARRELEDRERAISDLSRLTHQADPLKEFVSDVIAHQADLRFITMAAQKFVEEANEYLHILNDFRTALPERLHHIEPAPAANSPVRQEVNVVSVQYRDLLHRANALSDRLSGVGGRQREHQAALDKARSWLRDAGNRCNNMLAEPVAAEPGAVQDQLERAKTLSNEFVAQGRLIDNVQQSLQSLLKELEGQIGPMEVSNLEAPVQELVDKYGELSDALGGRIRELDTALVQSQGLQDALDGLVSWLSQVEGNFKLQLKPASLIKERLSEQIREHRTLQSDIDSHRSSIESMTNSVSDLVTSSSNARLANKVEGKLNDVLNRYEKLCDKLSKRGEFLDDVSQSLNTFNNLATSLEGVLREINDVLESRELSRMSDEEYATKINQINEKLSSKRDSYDDCIKIGKELISQRDVTDTAVVRDRMKALENQWRELTVSLDEKHNLAKQRAEKLQEYDSLCNQVKAWLTNMERRVSGLSPVAVDLEVIKNQTEELKPILKEYKDYLPTIDKVNEQGESYNNLLRGDGAESPYRKKGAYSPTKRTSPMRQTPSPTKLGVSSTSPLSQSSGFSSRRSSQDGFHLEELSSVQQQISEVNNRYNLLGARLTDRSSDLDNTRDDLRKLYDNLRTLNTFLEKVQRQIPHDSVTTKEDADKCIRTTRQIIEEMYEKQSLLDSTKTQGKELIRRKLDGVGSKQVKNDIDAVVEKWKTLHDLCKSRINFSEQLRDFLDNHDSLSSWLMSKEKMLTVLGPISSDPRMVQSQVQQVQVLRDEFRSQEPQLVHLKNVGGTVIDHLETNRDPQAKNIAGKLKSIEGKWSDLLNRLEERANSLGAAADSSREFDNGLSRLRDALQAISDNLDDLPKDKDPQDILRKIENLERQLEGQRPLLADAEARGAQLCAVLGDPTSRADVTARVGALGKQYQTLQKKLDNRKAETEAALRDGRNFSAACARTLGWLSEELSGLSDRFLISAHKPTLTHQLESIVPLYRDITTREHEIIMLLNKGRDLAGKPGVDKTLQRDLDKISQQWDKLKRDVTDRHNRLQTCMELCRKHYATLKPFDEWLQSAENRLQLLKPQALSKSQVDQQLSDLQAFRNDIWKKSGEYESCRSIADAFISACDIDKEGPKEDMKDIKERWDKLNNDLLAKTSSLEDYSRRLGEFYDGVRDLNHAVGRCEDRLGAHDSLGAASRDPKLFERIKDLRADAVALYKPLEELRKLADKIIDEAHNTGMDTDQVRCEVDALADRIEELHGRLGDRCNILQTAATAVMEFNEQVKNLAIDLTGLEHAIELLPPPAREIPVVEKQIHHVAGIIDRIDNAVDRVNEVEHSAESLVESGFSPDSVQTLEQVTGLKKQLVRLEGKAKDHDGILNDTLESLRSFYHAHDATMKDIQNAGEQLRKLKPVSSELAQIRNQQTDFARFRTSTIEPLSAVVKDVNKLGQDLVRTAQTGVNTGILEKDLEKMNDRWNDLNDKMNERDRRLDVGLLQSGKFQEALDGLAKWLADTEEMIANQKPPSADYQVVKAQLQEQKFLKKMLLDRQNSMSSLCNLGKEVGAGCDPQERARIEKQLHDLMGRFDRLTDNAQKRMHDLEQAMLVAKQFQDKLNPLLRWLDDTEKTIKVMELIPTDEEKIQERIREHNILHNEIISKQPHFSELTDIATNLISLVGEDEGGDLADRLQDATDRYGQVVASSEALGELLAQSKEGLRHLVLTYQELVAWMERMDMRLNRCRVVPVHTDRLLEQMNELVELTEEIASHQPEIDSTVDSGLELMKHISNEEALKLKDKLDSLQRRYSDLTGRGADFLKHAQEALPIVEQFHNAHNRLIDWITAAESVLSGTGEPKESAMMKLEKEIVEMRHVLEAVNLFGPQLCQLSPGEGAGTIETIVMRDNRRFEAVVEQIQRKAERLQLSKQRTLEVLGDMDELLEWFREMEAALRDSEAPSGDPGVIRVQLKEQRALNDDISSQKGRVRDVIAAAKKVVRESQPHSDTSLIREKLEDLRETTETVTGLSSTRLSILEQALSLAEHFTDTHLGLISWLDDIEHQINMLAMPALRPDQIAIQQDKNEMLLQSITEHKPLLDKLNKTGEALIGLVNEDDGAKIQDIVETDNARYNALKFELRQRQQALEQALQESSQFSDKLEGMLRALAGTSDQVNSAEPISAHPPKIEDQIAENNGLAGDIEARGEAYAAVKKAASEVISKAPNQHDPAVRDIKNKLDKLNKLWADVQKATSSRGRDLNAALGVAERFWRQLQGVMGTLGELREALASQELPAAEPQAIQLQQVVLQEIRQEIDQTKPEVEQVRRTGNDLMNLCGEPDKPEVKKNLEDLDNVWDNITALYARREENLIDAMEKAMEFHETLQNLLEFMKKAEHRFANLGVIGSDIEDVKKQIKQLKDFKDDVDPYMVKVESLNRQAVELTERTSSEQAAAIREPLTSVNRRWEALLRGMVERQKQLEHALLHLGQFQHALSELLVWIQKTDTTLDQLKPVAGDAQVLEVELAKLKVLCNDIQAHQSSVDTLNDAGRQLIESEKGSDEASTTQDKLMMLNKQWRDLLQKASNRQHELEEALREAQRFSAEIQDMLGWLGDVDGLLGASRPVGGLPETASEQLERFMEIYRELDDNRPKVESLLQQGNDYLKKQPNVAGSNLQHTLRALKQRWDAVNARASDKKIKLEIALKEATEFHDSLQAFVDWLTNAEKTLSQAKAVSRVMETVLSQIEEHKSFQKEVSIHREAMLLLDKKGTHLKYFSQKQDVILIKNLLVSVQHRWERVVARSAERTRALDHGYKEAKEFHDSWHSLMEWLEETEKSLDQTEDDTQKNDPQKIKQRLMKHRETQKLLSQKQGQYDATTRCGKALVERAPRTDEAILTSMLSRLKESWSRVCTKSVDRQRKLEEALLFSGQFSEALSALLEWLRRTHGRLSDEGPVHGDLDTVTALVEQHKTLQADLQSRSEQLKGVIKTGHEIQASGADPDTTKHLKELQQLWDSVNSLSRRKAERLEDALREAEKLHKSVNVLLEWLSDAETKLRFASAAPEDEEQAQKQLHDHMMFMRELKDKESSKDYTLELAHTILNKAHPDAVTVIKHWITIIQSRWDEVSQWALQRENKLSGHLQNLKDLDESLEELLRWLAGLESTLHALESEPLPDDLATLEGLISDHNDFMENTASRQPEVDRACKPKAQPKDHRKMTKMRTQTPVFKGSREHGLAYKTSRASPGREPTKERALPHYGPRFPPQGSKMSDSELRSPRARLLWDAWRRVWLMAWERQRRLHDHQAYLRDMERVRNFSWDEWRKRFLKFMNHKKSRLTDLFRKMDKDNNGLIPRDDFIDGIMKTKFDTSHLEMNAVADLFDRNSSGLIDWQEFLAALRPDWQERRPEGIDDKIHDEVKRLVMLCTCRQKFRVFQVGEGKYRFGDSQKLRLVRILRSTVMVRVGGGWVALEEFLIKNDPCRAKGRTNIELREQFILADGVSQSMAAFKPRAHSAQQSPGSPASPAGYRASPGPITKVVTTNTR